MKEAGHTFLARMGKKRLRPGGKKGTEWLLSKGAFTPETIVLEAACNMGTTAIELVKRYGCSITACDLDKKALERAKENVRKAGLETKITLQHADATALPFADASFDVVLNEAMLTMLPQSSKEKAVASYLRVLRPGGILLTHDVTLVESSPEEQHRICKELSNAINVSVFPLSVEGWLNLFMAAEFSATDHIHGDTTLMSINGMLYDEGIINTLHIMFNSMKIENRSMFVGMRNFFLHRKRQLNFIAVASFK